MFRKYKDGEITNFQSYIMIISILLNGGIFTLTRDVASVSRQDAWISILLMGLYLAVMTGIIFFIGYQFPKSSFFEFTSYLLSKPVAYIILIIYSIYAIATSAVVTRLIAEINTVWILRNTPAAALCFIFVVTAACWASRGLTVVARMGEILLFILIPFFLFIFLGIGKASLFNIRPVGGTGMTAILRGAMQASFAFGGYDMLLILYPFVSNKSSKDIKYSIYTILVVTVVYLSAVFMQLLVFGPYEIQHYLFPIIAYLEIIEFPALERMEAFFIFLWIYADIITIIIVYITACILLQFLLKTKKISTIAFALAPVVFILSLIPQSTTDVGKYGNLVSLTSMSLGSILPILLLIMYLIKGNQIPQKKHNR